MEKETEGRREGVREKKRVGSILHVEVNVGICSHI
jgi:hypothetical protein